MRYVQPGIVVFCLALFASLGLHLPIYGALGVLAKVMMESKDQKVRKRISFDIVNLDSNSETSDDSSTEKQIKSKDSLTDQKKEHAPDPKLVTKTTPTPVPEKAPKRDPVRLQLVEQPKKPKIAVKPELQNKLAVKQRSDNPDVPPPENSRFIAKENRRVEEETVAIIRNMHRDDPDPTPGHSPGEDTGEIGDADKFESADLMDREGSDERVPTRLEAESAKSDPSHPSTGDRMANAVRRAPVPGATQPNQDSVKKETYRAGSSLSGGQEQALVIEDGMGTFQIPSRPLGRGPDDKGGELRKGSSAKNKGNQSGARNSGKGNNLRLSWSQFEETFGAEELQRQRETYLRQKRSKSRGHSSANWRKFRAAIENFVTDVKPGNQTALNAAASPFAEYIAAVHRRIHREFAYRFLRSLPIASGPYSDMSLRATLEIVFNRDGSIHKIGVVRSSGFLPFDLGAFEAVMRAQPFPEPPSQILSGDSRVYVHWGFYRNQRQCGTFNVKPFILPHPPGTPSPDQSPFTDPLGS